MAFLPENTKKLGSGLMRLPLLKDGDENIDLEQVKKMADHFLEQGYTYFDTAYPYHMGFSERAVKTVLVERHPRESFLLADKMPIFRIKEPDDVATTFEEQLERTGAGYFDMYLLHAMSADRMNTVRTCKIWEYLLQEKAKGRIRRLGFSFHDSPEALDSMLNELPEAEFVQLQINYADWEDREVQSRRCYEVAQKHGKPVIVMEPIRGGSLASEKAVFAPLLKEAKPEASLASWALRYAASLPGVAMVLSGMSTMEQMAQNVELFNTMAPLSDKEQAILAKAAEMLRAAGTIPCTGCNYCAPCPQGIVIPNVFTFLAYTERYDLGDWARSRYEVMKAHAGDCVGCGSCESRCPYQLPIRKMLKGAAEVFGK